MDSEKRGTKRKHGELDKQDLKARVQGKLHHSVKEVKKAAKKAKTFETQRAIKRLKDLRKKSADPKDISAAELELECLKDIDHEYIGSVALTSKLKKTRSLHDHPAVKEAMSQELDLSVTKTSSDASVEKVQNRLLSSKVLAEEVHSILEELKNIIAPKPPSNDEINDVGDVENVKQSTKAKSKGKGIEPNAESNLEASLRDNEDAVEEEEIDNAGWESGSVDEDGQPEDDAWESGSVHGDDSAPESSSDDELEVDAKPANKRTKLSNATSSESVAKSTGVSSTFLPSLSVGYIRGSDDSDFSDSEAKIADPDIKKNRRGQRARRAIWEKKYGRNANHKKKEAAENQKAEALKKDRRSRPFGQKQGRSGPSVADLKNRPTDSGWGGRGNTQNTSRPPSAPVTKRPTEQKALHPSWEAKMKQKEKAGVGIIPSQGKKIVFS